MPDTVEPRLNKPVLKPLKPGPKMLPGTPVFPMPELAPFTATPPLAVLNKPDILPATPPLAVLKKPETLVPVLLKPELGTPLLVMNPMPVFVLPEFP